MIGDSVFGVLTRISVLGVHGYRLWISPKRRKRCASGVLHGWEHSCSTVTLEALREDGLRGAAPKVRAQFAKCALAAETIDSKDGDANATVPLAAGEEEACCELDLHAETARKMIIELFTVWCVGKYLMAGAFHAGMLEGWIEGFLYNLLGPMFMGSAASMLWPLVVLSLVMDSFAVYALYKREDAAPYLVGSFGLSAFVMFFDPFLASMVNLDWFGSAWNLNEMTGEIADAGAGKIWHKGLFGIIWPKKLAVLIVWGASLFMLLAVSELSRSCDD